MPTSNELHYRRVMTAIGITLLAFVGMINTVGIVVSGVNTALHFLPISAMWAEIIYQLLYGALYLAAFMLPVLILKWRIKKIGCAYLPIKTETKLSPLLLPILIGGVTLIWAQANINASLMNIFTFNLYAQELLGSAATEIKGYQIVLIFLVDCMVPAFCEEFLFRGAILTNCLPFGRSNAILISSLLFSLMHQNPAQILYAFAAGILLGLVYERTGSIWNCVLLHLVNNFASTALEVLSGRFGYEFSGVTYLALECALYLIGMLCIAIVVIRESHTKAETQNGVFGQSLPASDSHAQYPVSARQAVRQFLNLPMIIFLAICLVQIITLLGTALFYGLLQ